MLFSQISAVFSGVGDLKRVFEEAARHMRTGQATLLFVDEIHRFNRAQQDAFLPVVEEGIVTLIGATTENPSFALNGALLSRCQVLVLKRLDDMALDQLADPRRNRNWACAPARLRGAREPARDVGWRWPLPAQHGGAAVLAAG